MEEYYLRTSAEAEILIKNNAQLLIDAKDGTTLKPNFEVSPGSTLEIQVEGCDN